MGYGEGTRTCCSVAVEDGLGFRGDLDRTRVEVGSLGEFAFLVRLVAFCFERRSYGGTVLWSSSQYTEREGKSNDKIERTSKGSSSICARVSLVSSAHTY